MLNLWGVFIFLGGRSGPKSPLQFPVDGQFLPVLFDGLQKNPMMYRFSIEITSV